MEKETNPYDGPERVSSSSQTGSSVKSIFSKVGLVGLALVGLLLIAALMIPMGRGGSTRHAARRNACIQNLRTIARGLQEYEAEHGTLPPAYTVDANGRRLHSWRTLILPYVDEKKVYDKIDLSKPWDDPVNAEARSAEVLVYSCPSSHHEMERTTYLAVLGDKHALCGSEGRKISELPRGFQSTFAVMDVDSDHAVHWMSPEDTDEETVMSIQKSTSIHHRGILLAAFTDGHVTAIPLDAKSESLREAFQKAEGE